MPSGRIPCALLPVRLTNKEFVFYDATWLMLVPARCCASFTLDLKLHFLGVAIPQTLIYDDGFHS